MDSCRFCGGPNTVINLFRADGGFSAIGFQAKSFLQINMRPGDGLPSAICIGCSSRLSECHAFKVQCEEYDGYFRSLVPLQNNGCLAKKGNVIKEEGKDEEERKEENESKWEVREFSRSPDRCASENGYDSEPEPTKDLKPAMVSREMEKRDINEDDINEHKPNAFQCDCCQLNFTTRSKLKKHLMVFQKSKRKISKKVDKINEKGTNGIVPPDQSDIDKLTKKFMCDVCGSMFKHQHIMTQHQLMHTGLKLFSCSICKKKFSRSSSVTNHMRIHDNIKPYVCDNCGKSFIKLSDLTRHKRIHSDAKDFSCLVCGKKFKRSFDLKAHMRCHTGDRPYACKCGKAYTSHSGMRKHRKLYCSDKVNKNAKLNVKTEKK